MLWCSECETMLEETDLHFRKAELEDDRYPWEMIAECPYCGNKALEDAGVCEICGDPCPPGEDYCKECEEELYKIVDEAVMKMGGDYLEAKEKLMDYIGRRWL